MTSALLFRTSPPQKVDALSAHHQDGKKAEIASRVAANFVGWEKDPRCLSGNWKR